MVTSNATQGEPIRRLVSDEDADFQEAVKNVLRQSYKDWPNEAGFLGLREERGPIEIPVTGTIPSWAVGSLYRTGPGQVDVPVDTSQGTKDKKAYRIDHWFDGLAHTHRFDIVTTQATDGDANTVKVFYSSRRQNDELAKEISKKGWPRYSFAQRSDPCLGLFGKFTAAWQALIPDREMTSKENMNVTIFANPPPNSAFETLKDNLVDGSYVAGRKTKIATNQAPSTDDSGALKHSPTSHHENDSRVVTGGHRGAGDIPVSIMWLGTDTANSRAIDPVTMEPTGYMTQADLHQDLQGPLSAAHAERDPITGDFYNFNLAFEARGPTYRFFRTRSDTGTTEILGGIRRSDIPAAYIHSFYLSSSFLVFCIPSTHLKWKGLSLAWERNILDSMKPFDKQNACKWFAIDRTEARRGVVAEWETPAGFFFHTVNAFEEHDDKDKADGTVSLYCDVVQYPTPDIISAFYTEVLAQLDDGKHTEKFWKAEDVSQRTRAELARHHVRVPLPNGKTTAAPNTGVITKKLPQLVSDVIVSIPGPHAGDLPTINPQFATKRSRFVYSLPMRGLSTLVDCIAKTDMETGEVLWWRNGHGNTPGEPIFIPRPGAEHEDDGVLLSVVLDVKEKTSFLLCLDAKTMVEMGRAEVGFAIGFGFHGVHIPAKT